jgi:perosamine synthetase
MKTIRISEPAYLGHEERYVADAIVRKNLSMREYVQRFEEAFARFVGVTHVIAVNNGTAALHTALLALGVGPGDEVIVPATTYIATANAVSYCGATPVIVDVTEDTWTLDWAKAFAAVTERTRGFIPVHLYGVCAGVTRVNTDFLWVLEDAAEAHGACEDGRGSCVGSYTEAGAFSFYGNKILTCGEGGAITTNSDYIAERCRLYRGVGQTAQYIHGVLGFNYRMTDPCGALGLAQVEQADRHLSKRAALGNRYRSLLRDVRSVTLQHQPPGSVDWVFPVLVDNRDEVVDILRAGGIETRPVFPPLHRQPIYADSTRSLPVAERIGRDGLLLPLHANMREEDVDSICANLIAAVASGVTR